VIREHVETIAKAKAPPPSVLSESKAIRNPHWGAAMSDHASGSNAMALRKTAPDAIWRDLSRSRPFIRIASLTRRRASLYVMGGVSNVGMSRESSKLLSKKVVAAYCRTIHINFSPATAVRWVLGRLAA